MLGKRHWQILLFWHTQAFDRGHVPGIDATGHGHIGVNLTAMKATLRNKDRAAVHTVGRNSFSKAVSYYAEFSTGAQDTRYYWPPPDGILCSTTLLASMIAALEHVPALLSVATLFVAGVVGSAAASGAPLAFLQRVVGLGPKRPSSPLLLLLLVFSWRAGSALSWASRRRLPAPPELGPAELGPGPRPTAPWGFSGVSEMHHPLASGLQPNFPQLWPIPRRPVCSPHPLAACAAAASRTKPVDSSTGLSGTIKPDEERSSQKWGAAPASSVGRRSGGCSSRGGCSL